MSSKELNNTSEPQAQPETPNAASPLHQFVLERLQFFQVKSDVLSAAIEFNHELRELASDDEVLNLVEELAAAVEQEMSEEGLLHNLSNELIELFNDDLADPYFFCEGVPYRAPSRSVEALVKHRFLVKKGYLPKAVNVREAFDVLESKARFEAPKVRLFNRVAKKGDAFYYDLCDRRYIEITSTGWEIVRAFPLFRRYKHQQAQVEPEPSGNPWEIFKFISIREQDQLLLLVYLIALFIPGIAHPLLAICGDQGSAKSFLCNIINRLIDPTLTERIIQPKNERDLIQTLRQKYVTVLDNIAKIEQRVSDILCQVCTGGGISYRALYTDEGENIAQFRHVVFINSIRLPIVNPDLMDRSIILKLQRIKPEERKPEQDLWHEFDAAQPSILGGIFDTLVKAMAVYPTVKTEKLPRLADFAKWGYAIAEALGKNGEQFLEDFSRNVKSQNESVMEKNVLCQAVLGLMDGKTTYLQTVSELHGELKKLVGEDFRDETFPKLPHHLRGQLDLLRTTLLEQGVSYQFFARNKQGVKILLTNISATTTKSSVTAQSPSSDTPDVPGEAGNLLISEADVLGVAGVPQDATPFIDFGEVLHV